MTDADELARDSMTAKERIEFRDSEASARTFMRRRHGVDPGDFEDPAEFQVAAAEADDDERSGSDADADKIAEAAMTLEDRLEFRESSEDSPAAFLYKKYDRHPGGFEDPTEYVAAVAREEQ